MNSRTYTHKGIADTHRSLVARNETMYSGQGWNASKSVTAADLDSEAKVIARAK